MTDSGASPTAMWITAAVFLAVLVAVSGCASDPAKDRVPRLRPSRIHAVGPESSELPYDHKVTYRQEGLTVGLQMQDDRARRLFFRERMGLDVDPFYAALGEPNRFVSFRLVVAATGEDAVHFHPQHVRLISDKAEHIYPLDLTRVYQFLQKLKDEEPEPALLEALTVVLYDRAEEVRPGSVVEKLLVFPEPRLDSTEWLLDLPFFQVGKESHSFRMAYAREFLQ